MRAGRLTASTWLPFAYPPQKLMLHSFDSNAWQELASASYGSTSVTSGEAQALGWPSWSHDSKAVAASFSPDGLQVFTRDAQGQMYTWDITPDP